MYARFRWRGTDSPSSGATIAVRPEGSRRINRPSDVIPVTLLRIERTRPCCEYVPVLRPVRVRLDFDALALGAVSDLDWLAVVGGGSVFA